MMNGRIICFQIIAFFISIEVIGNLSAQNIGDSSLVGANCDSTVVNKKKLKLLIASEITVAGATFFYLNELWYKNYPRTHFHWFNDNREWLQMDKIGHAYSAYHIGEIGYSLLKSCNVKEKKSAIIGGSMGLAYLSIIEILDGYSAQWGASYGDVVANISGAALFTTQQLLWKEQRILLKYSYHSTMYAPMRADALGKNTTEQVIKDYNGQTYWLSCNLRSFCSTPTQLPPWLAISFGYGANAMLGGNSNPIAQNLQRYRQFYIAPDIHFRKIKTQKLWLRNLFYALDFFKCPMPTLEYNGQKQLRAYWLYF